MKSPCSVWYCVNDGSHPARGAWIEIPAEAAPFQPAEASHPARGAWIEIPTNDVTDIFATSHPARGAWIEIPAEAAPFQPAEVAPRKGCVD